MEVQTHLQNSISMIKFGIVFQISAKSSEKGFSTQNIPVAVSQVSNKTDPKYHHCKHFICAKIGQKPDAVMFSRHVAMKQQVRIISKFNTIFA